MKKLYTAIIVFSLLQSYSFAQNDSSGLDVYNLTLEELMNIEVKIITKKAITIRDNPAIITVISEGEIQRSGARDLKEVLELFVPGFQFGADVEGAIGISVRGMWAFEGKLLLMFNGLECNEEMFANVIVGGHYPVDIIKKIEISRGPGSAIYGGYAGLSVINVITKDADNKGGYAKINYSQMSKSYANRGISAGYGNSKKDFSYSLNAVYNQSVRSQNDIIDYFGNSMPMLGNSDINSIFVNTQLKYKQLELLLLTDNFSYEQVDLWGENYVNGPLNENYSTYIAQLSYALKLNHAHTLTPKIIAKYQEPWQLDVPDEEYINSKYNFKYTAGLTHSWEILKQLDLLTGLEYYTSSLVLPENHKYYEETFNNGTNSLDISNFTLYSQAMFFNKIVNITLGGRFDNSSQYGNSFVPRVAFTKAFKNLHMKAMFSQSFRVPGGIIPNRIPDGVSSIEPEKATNYEIEAGYQFHKKLYLGINAFDITFNKVIVYGSDPATGLGTYINSGTIGSQGIEAEMKYFGEIINLTFNYAYHRANGIDVMSYSVPGQNKSFLGFSPNRFNSLVSIKINKILSLNITAQSFSERYAYTHYGLEGEHVLEKIDADYIFNANLKFNNFPIKKMDVFVGVNNITDEDYLYFQPYNGEHGAIPSLSRAYSMKISYRF